MVSGSRAVRLVIVGVFWSLCSGALLAQDRSETLSRPVETERASLEGRRDVAVLLAVNEYDHWRDLRNPVFDAKALARDLEEIYGFEVHLIENPTLSQMEDTLHAYANTPLGPNDQLFVFIAGHGNYDEQFLQDGYVAAKDSRASLEDPYKKTVLEFNWVRRRLANSQSDHVLLVLDVCYGGTFNEPISESRYRGEDPLYELIDREELIDRKLAYRTRRYMTSGGRERVPDGRPGEHTPFMRQLLEALRTRGGEDGVLTLAELAVWIERVNPEPRAGEFERNEPGSDFLFITRDWAEQMASELRQGPSPLDLPEEESSISCDAFINGAKARMSRNMWSDGRQVLAGALTNCQNNAEFQYLYAIALARISRADSTAKAIAHLGIADSLNGQPAQGDELQGNIDRAFTALWGQMVNDGVELLQAGQVDQALGKLELAVQINPQGKEGHLALGAAYQTKGEYDKAITEYERALEIDPAYDAVTVRLGQVINRLMEFRISDETLTDLGFRMANVKQYDLAEQLLSRAVAMTDSTDVEPISYLAFVLIQKNDLPEAKSVLQKQLEFEPSNAEAWEYLGLVERDLGNMAAGQAALRRAEAIPLELEVIRVRQDQDKTVNVEATFSNRTDRPVRNITVRFKLISRFDREVLETKEATVAAQPLAPGEADDVSVEFAEAHDEPDDPWVMYEIVP